MREWKRETNKDYHFIAIEATTTKYYAFQFEVSISGEMQIYMLLKTVSQSKGCYLNTGTANLTINSWYSACMVMSTSGVSAGIKLVSSTAKQLGTEIVGANFVVNVSKSKDDALKVMQHILHAHTGVVRVNMYAVQGTV
jgi:hypothetical protein